MFYGKRKIYLMMEYCRGGELFERLAKGEKCNEKRAAKLLEQMLSAVNYMHAHGVVHRDLKVCLCLCELGIVIVSCEL